MRSATGDMSAIAWNTSRSSFGGAAVSTKKKAASAAATASMGTTNMAYADNPITERRTPRGPVAATASAADRREDARWGVAISPIAPPSREKGAAPPTRSQNVGCPGSWVVPGTAPLMRSNSVGW